MKFTGLVTTLWVRAYLKVLGKSLRDHGIAEAKQILNSIEHDAKTYFDEDTHRPDYDTTAFVSAQCSVVLAAYQNLVRLFEEKDAALALVNEAMSITWRNRSDMYFKFSINFFRDPLKSFKKMNFVQLVRRIMGPGMELEQHSTENSLTLTIHRCAYNQFLNKHDAAFLNPVFCRWDGIWMDIYNRSSRPIQVARPSCKS